MRHDLGVEGPGFKLRPVTESDSDFIISLRTDPRLGQFINATSPRREDQIAWLEKYYAREGDYYFLVTRHDGTPEGAIAIYDIIGEPRNKRGEWGRWILKHGSLAAIESALLIYEVAFDKLHMDMVYCRTVALNKPVISFHASCGLRTHGVVPNNMIRDGKSYDAIEQQLERKDWLDVRANLLAKAARLARRLPAGAVA
jgi:RimJ/RimL family protein N-acetyltransferase